MYIYIYVYTHTHTHTCVYKAEKCSNGFFLSVVIISSIVTNSALLMVDRKERLVNCIENNVSGIQGIQSTYLIKYHCTEHQKSYTQKR